MTAYLLTIHLFNFMAPAAMLAVLLVGSSRLFFSIFESKRLLAHTWRAQIAINFIVGLLVLAAGLVLFGHDGKMLTYLALVLVTAASQGWQLGGWKK